MFSKYSKIISSEGSDIESQFVTMDKLSSEKRKNYALSYHSGFKSFDYSQIDFIQQANVKQNTEIYVFHFVDSYDRKYEIMLDKDQRIYTSARGFLPAERITMLDIFLTYEGRHAKLVKKVKDIKPETVSMVDIGVMYNQSVFVNGILCKTM